MIECLPAGENFPVYVLARCLHVNRKHILNLIESGELVGFDLRNASGSRSCIRVPRQSIEEFLKNREIIVVSKLPHA